MSESETLPDLRRSLLVAMLKLSAKRKRRVSYDEAASNLGLSGRYDLLRAARGDVKHGFGPKSQRRKKVERFIEEMLK